MKKKERGTSTTACDVATLRIEEKVMWYYCIFIFPVLVLVDYGDDGSEVL